MDGGMVPVDLWDRKSVGTTDEASKYLANLLEAKVFDFPKPYTLIQRALRLSNSKDDVVLDFFAGTSPSAHAAPANPNTAAATTNTAFDCLISLSLLLV